MTQDLTYRGFVVKLSDDLPAHRQASYQIVSSPDGSTGLPVLVECGSFEDLALIVKRVIDRRLRGDEVVEQQEKEPDGPTTEIKENDPEA